MSYGLRVWDAAGNLTLDISDGVGFVVAQISGSLAGNSNTTITLGASTTNSSIIFTDKATNKFPFTGICNNGSVTVYNNDPATLTYVAIIVNFLQT